MTWGEWMESEYSKDIPKTKPCRNCGASLQLGFHDDPMYGDAFGYSNGACLNPFANTKDFGKIFTQDRITDGFNAHIETAFCGS